MNAITVDDVSFSYGDRTALDGLSFGVQKGETFGLLGPNGSGKSTLFRLLSTLMPIQDGKATIFEQDVGASPDAVRRLIGVTFQSPSLDLKLTVEENLKTQGNLYGLSGRELKTRCEEAMTQLGVIDRRRDYAEKLSGGLKRRVEIAKTLLHFPRLLLLDEPSTGLDPGARHDLWTSLFELRRQTEVTILVTTHLMEEAQRCDRLAILDEGKLIATGTPDELQSMAGGDSVTIVANDPDQLRNRLAEHFNSDVARIGDSLRIEHANGHELLSQIATHFAGEFKSLTLGKPTLEDVFIKLTGRRLDEEVGE